VKYQDQLYYHIYNRGAHKEKIFFSEDHYLRCLNLLYKYADKYAASIIAYCFMPNHYHLILQQKEHGSISKCLQTTFNAYSQTVNLMVGHSGTLFQGKAKSKLIDSDEYVLQVIRYIHLNPGNAGLVQKPEDWPFSDYREWIKEIGDLPKDTANRMVPSEGGKLRAAYFASGKEYQQFVEEYRVEQKNEKLDKFLFKE